MLDESLSCEEAAERIQVDGEGIGAIDAACIWTDEGNGRYEAPYVDPAMSDAYDLSILIDFA
ncbi:hypothetical protein [uncultured Enorma sp.]|uniref:hypothetical protein n=1 Tax=uncultured Enorma sp. TaxID=1714346 RepID=UPI0028056829|nr:hypothetical protein [uncultured Enorma sp.]